MAFYNGDAARDEFGLKNTLKSVELAKKMKAQAINLYNKDRMHLSLDFRKPNEVHQDYNKYKNKNYKKDQKKVKIKNKNLILA